MYYLFQPVINAFGDLTSYTATKHESQMSLTNQVSLSRANYVKATTSHASPSYYVTDRKENFVRILEEELPPKLKAILLLIDTSEV